MRRTPQSHRGLGGDRGGGPARDCGDDGRAIGEVGGRDCPRLQRLAAVRRVRRDQFNSHVAEGAPAGFLYDQVAGEAARGRPGRVVPRLGASVKVTLEIEATIEDGAPENVVRTVTENSRTGFVTATVARLEFGG